MRVRVLVPAFIVFAGFSHAVAQQLSTTERTKLDAALQQLVTKTAVPSASIGVSRGGSVVYARAFGDAVLPQTLPESGASASSKPAPAVIAKISMADPIGSISKQFTAACILLLQEQGKLRLDDRWLAGSRR